jgi:hypothetical protein
VATTSPLSLLRGGAPTYDRAMDAQPAEAMAVLVMLLAAAVLGPHRTARVLRPLVGLAGRLHRTPSPVSPPGRPIEQIARDAQRLGPRFRYVPAGVSFARFEGRRQAYDDVLSEACRALDVEHLLGVLRPGTDLDAERQRVEVALQRAGLQLGDTY